VNRTVKDRRTVGVFAVGDGTAAHLPSSYLSLHGVRACAVASPPEDPAIAGERMAVFQQRPALVPLIGQVQAGLLTLADQLVEDFFLLPRQLVGDGTLFLLRVSGDSMIGAAIADGDLVVVREQSVVENGEIVVARVDEEATIKRYKQSGENIWLIPENKEYRPIPGEKAVILGKAVAVIRKL
jgi:repressor LexA